VTSTNTPSFSSWTITTNSSPVSSVVSSTNILTIVEDAYGEIRARADWSDGTHPAVNCPSAPTRNGYTFNGWFTAASAGTKRCDASGSYTPDATETLHAQRTAINYTITIDSNGGGSVSNPSSYTINTSSTQTRTLTRPTAPA
jgi:uncharacterized repeat protein (TIGR02543 family)